MSKYSHPVIDFHGASTGCGDRLRALTAQGKVSCVKAIDGKGWAIEAAKLARASGVPHVIVYRQTHPEGLPDDHPNLHLSPHKAAEQLWNAVKIGLMREGKHTPEEDKLATYKDLVYIEPTNEPGVVENEEVGETQVEWMGEFFVEIAQMMLADGWKPALAGYNTGQPSEYHIRKYFVKLLRLFEENWDDCLWTMHEAKLAFRDEEKGVEYDYLSPMKHFVPYRVDSADRIFRVCDEHGIRRPRVFISEMAWEHNNIPDKDQFRAEVQELCAMDARRPEVVGRVIYSTHSGGKNDMWSRVRDKLNGHSPWLTEYVTSETSLNTTPINPPSGKAATKKPVKPTKPTKPAKPTGGMDQPTAGVVRPREDGSPLPVRSGSSGHAETMVMLPEGAEMTILEKEGDWYRVRIDVEGFVWAKAVAEKGEGQQAEDDIEDDEDTTEAKMVEGWIWSALLDIDGDKAVVSADSGMANVRTGPGKANHPVPMGWLATGVAVEISGPEDPEFLYHPVRFRESDLNTD